MGDQVDFFFSSLDFHLARGLEPNQALAAAIEDYAAVYHAKDDGRTPLQRAAQAVLKRMGEDSSTEERGSGD